jgi:predicted ATP-dependent protease
MTAKVLQAEDVGLPVFASAPTRGAQPFDLSSHERAREALAFGLDTPGTDYNVYVLGPDRSGRMTATHEFVEAWVEGRQPCDDWVYVFDFDAPSTPKPLQLPAGTAAQLKAAVDEVVPALARELAAAFSSEAYQRQLTSLRAAGDAKLAERSSEVENEAQLSGLSIVNTPQGVMIAARGPDGAPVPLQTLRPDQRREAEERGRHLMEKLAEINREGARFQREYFESVKEFNREVAEQATAGLLTGLVDHMPSIVELDDWLRRFAEDVVDHHELFLVSEGAVIAANTERAVRRYGVNLLVDRSKTVCPAVVVEQNPSYENLFGLIEYRQLPGGGLETDVTLIRPGALHRANGGVLILRAEALVKNPLLWEFLKAALRDREIRVEEFYRANSPPIAGAPKPAPVPLDLNVVMVGAPQWYYAFFALDQEFQLYFKVKAEIEPTVDATRDNLDRYAGVIAGAAEAAGIQLDDGAMCRLLGLASRWAEDRRRLSARFEMVTDVVIEAGRLANGGPVTEQDVKTAVATRRRRNGQVEDRVQRSIEENTILIQTVGEVVGQINGLTVQALGDHTFGTPARITARSSVGRRGVVNIERLVAMSGPIQQKGTLVLQGILMRRFAHGFPLSFDCSVTFEPMYGGVEGDSASMAEYIAIISELADVPIRQDLAITGSINQLGESQVIGGVHHKVEGFFRACNSAGGLSGSQGVVIPAQNEDHVVVRDQVRDAVAQRRFHLYSVRTVEEAIALFTGMEVGEQGGSGEYPGDSVYGRVMATLVRFDEVLAARGI